MPRKKRQPVSHVPATKSEPPPIEAVAVDHDGSVKPIAELAEPLAELVEPDVALQKFRVTCCKVKKPGDPEKSGIVLAEDARSAVIAFLEARPVLRSDEWSEPQAGLVD